MSATDPRKVMRTKWKKYKKEALSKTNQLRDIELRGTHQTSENAISGLINRASGYLR